MIGWVPGAFIWTAAASASRSTQDSALRREFYPNEKLAFGGVDTWRGVPRARIAETNRTVPPDYIIMKVDELTGGTPFGKLEDVITEDELRALSDEYKRIAGFSLAALKP